MFVTEYCNYAILIFSSKARAYPYCAQFKEVCLDLAFDIGPRKVYLRGRLSIVDLLVLTSLDQLLSKLNILFSFLKNNLNVEVNCTKPSPLVSVP